MSDCATGRCLGPAHYYGNAFAGELTIPTDTFSSVHSLFVKLDRPSWFFDEVGWLEIPPTARPNWIAALGRKLVERPLPAKGHVATVITYYLRGWDFLHRRSKHYFYLARRVFAKAVREPRRCRLTTHNYTPRYIALLHHRHRGDVLPKKKW